MSERGPVLVQWARAKLREAFGGAPAVRPEGAWCSEPGAVFVTLRRRGRLHGCIGSLEATRAIVDDVGNNAVAAATRDPRAVPIDVATANDEVAFDRGYVQIPGDEVDAYSVASRIRVTIDGNRSGISPPLLRVLDASGAPIAPRDAIADVERDEPRRRVVDHEQTQRDRVRVVGGRAGVEGVGAIVGHAARRRANATPAVLRA